jgi:hypothetical protein
MSLEKIFILDKLNENFSSTRTFLFIRSSDFNFEKWNKFRVSCKNNGFCLFMLKNREILFLFKKLILKSYIFDFKNFYMFSLNDYFYLFLFVNNQLNGFFIDSLFIKVNTQFLLAKTIYLFFDSYRQLYYNSRLSFFIFYQFCVYRFNFFLYLRFLIILFCTLNSNFIFYLKK